VVCFFFFDFHLVSLYDCASLPAESHLSSSLLPFSYHRSVFFEMDRIPSILLISGSSGFHGSFDVGTPPSFLFLPRRQGPPFLPSFPRVTPLRLSLRPYEVTGRSGSFFSFTSPRACLPASYSPGRFDFTRQIGVTETL